MSVQILAINNQSCLPRDFVHRLNPPICAENSMRTFSHGVTCTASQSTTTLATTNSEIMDHDLVTATTISQSVEITQVKSSTDGETLATMNSETVDHDSVTATTFSQNVEIT